jgi:hypothetical protein
MLAFPEFERLDAARTRWAEKKNFSCLLDPVKQLFFLRADLMLERLFGSLLQISCDILVASI